MEQRENRTGEPGVPRSIKVGVLTDLLVHCHDDGEHQIWSDKRTLIMAGKPISARRAAWILSGQVVDAHRHLRETCGRSDCIRPDHQTTAKPPGSSTRYVPTGAPRGQRPGRGVRLNRQVVRAIRAACAVQEDPVEVNRILAPWLSVPLPTDQGPISQNQMAIALVVNGKQVSRETLSCIIQEKTWRGV